MKYQKNDFNGKTIHVFEDAFSLHKREYLYLFLADSCYYLKGNTLNGEHVDLFPSMRSLFSEEDFQRFGIFNDLPKEIDDIVKGYSVARSYSLLQNWCVTNKFHTDGRSSNLTFLYYGNLKWDYDWGGETLFANDDMSEIIYTSMYKPGKILIFDSSIPHRPIPPISTCPFLRSSFVINLEK